ncbi:uncharacterized protein STEHIDRAFT_111813 [Stereum hirsutum FP-91666 SS1]|uniref:uncharacterized protein n=1 Tax=Stereum hirsutum (strain FP-91666) TaxID=721885 RepID=UPI0004449C52|nr:uncharacterized protein STEHIDRAFT_111813 [Stereum hirsutum FP-91666 SS1]EIM86335.1 hypothetical protein STEHIDRAFT_111813 [Stereum hirsutum FP-91666 SS1]
MSVFDNKPDTGRPGVTPGGPTDLFQCRNAHAVFVGKILYYYYGPKPARDTIIFSDERVLSAPSKRAPTELSGTARAITASLDHSKANIEALKKFGWVFETSQTSRITTVKMSRYSFNRWQKTPFTVPSWKMIQSKDGAIAELDSTLEIYQNEFPGAILRGLSEDTKPNPGMPILDYSYLNEVNYKNHSNYLGAMKRVISAFALANPMSELAVQQSYGAMIKGFFEDAGRCSYGADNELDQPTILGCFGSQPKADLLTRMVLEHEEGQKWKRWFDPVIAVGETKRKGTPSVPAQMACSLQPTLHVFMALLVKQWKDKPQNTKKSKVIWEEIEIPNWMWICGLAFDADGVTFHGYRPVIRDNGYEFVCWNISEKKFSTIFKEIRDVPDPKPHTRGQIDLLKALIWMWRHTLDLEKELRNLKFDLPEAFEDLGRAWDMDPKNFKEEREAEHLAKRKPKEKADTEAAADELTGKMATLTVSGSESGVRGKKESKGK